MTAKDRKTALFARLKADARPSIMPGKWTSMRDFKDPITQFIDAQKAVKGRVIAVENLQAVFPEISSIMNEFSAQSVVLSDEHPLEALSDEKFPETILHRLQDYQHNPDRWRNVCEKADIGITSAEAMLVETGTVICSSGSGKSRLVSLLPPVHVVICPKSRFETDIFGWLEARNGKWPANTVLISGPSKTADIEQTMSVGIHGPKKLIVIIYSDKSQ